jgi:hypothetical protein
VGLTQAVARRAGAELRCRRRGGSRCRWAPVSGGVESGSCSTGEDGDGETQPNSRGLGGGPAHRGWRMTAAVEESSGVLSFSVAIDRRKASREGRWRRERVTRAWTRETGQKAGRAAAGAFYGGPVAWQRERAGGPELKGGIYMVHHQ